MTLKAQEDEIRHIKRKKFEMQAKLDKITKENIALSEQNGLLQGQLRDLLVGS